MSDTARDEAASAAELAPTKVSMMVQIDPFLMRTGVPFRGDVQALAEQMTRYVSERMSERFTADHQGAGLFVAVVVSRGDESGTWQYREGHYADAKPVTPQRRPDMDDQGGAVTQSVWREGDRIRRQDGTGYGDRVSDEDIRKHIADNGDDRLFVAFAEAVLAIRALERLV